MLDRGAVIDVASTAAFQPVPYMAVYGGSEAFVLSFTEALWAETRGTGVRVTAICPGSTETGFFDIARENAQVGRRIPRGALYTPHYAPWTAEPAPRLPDARATGC
jgi:short-subunit dehydrogenase